MIIQREVENLWLSLHAALRRPESETEYLELIAFLDELTDQHDVNLEPWGSLFDLIAGYIAHWEAAHETIPEATPAQVLASLMAEHGLSQYALDKEGLASQSLLSNILSGKRQISKTLAKRLGNRFHVNPVVFL
jgi:HTH-type transcriptional regulator / antitoxin HigA